MGQSRVTAYPDLITSKNSTDLWAEFLFSPCADSTHYWILEPLLPSELVPTIDPPLSSFII